MLVLFFLGASASAVTPPAPPAVVHRTQVRPDWRDQAPPPAGVRITLTETLPVTPVRR